MVKIMDSGSYVKNVAASYYRARQDYRLRSVCEYIAFPALSSELPTCKRSGIGWLKLEIEYITLGNKYSMNLYVTYNIGSHASG